MSERTPPCDITAEAATLGAMMLDPKALAEARGLLTAEDIYRPEHQTIFKTLCVMADAGQPVDLVTLRAKMQEDGTLDGIGGMDCLIALADGVPSAANVGHYAEIVRDRATKRRIITLSAQAMEDAYAKDGTKAHEVLQTVRQGLEEVTRQSETAPAFLTAADLLAKYPTQREPVIEGVLRRGEVGNLISGPKHFKSWLVMNAAFCIADGRPLLRFPTRQGRVLLMDYELPPETLAWRARAVAEAMNLDPASVGERFALRPLRGKPLDVDGLGLYLRSLPPGRFDCIIIDPLYRTFPKGIDENSNAAVAEVFASLQGYAEDLDAALIVVHHLTKGEQGGKSITDLGAGAGSQSRAADGHLAIRPHAEEGAAVLCGVVRSFSALEPVAMRWRFPLWELAEDLDPADLRGKKSARAKDNAPTTPPTPPKPSFNAASFAATFVRGEPRPKGAIIAEAFENGVSERRAGALLDSAEAQGRAYPWSMGSDRRKHYANRPQPQLAEATR